MTKNIKTKEGIIAMIDDTEKSVISFDIPSGAISFTYEEFCQNVSDIIRTLQVSRLDAIDLKFLANYKGVFREVYFDDEDLIINGVDADEYGSVTYEYNSYCPDVIDDIEYEPEEYSEETFPGMTKYEVVEIQDALEEYHQDRWWI